MNRRSRGWAPTAAALVAAVAVAWAVPAGASPWSPVATDPSPATVRVVVSGVGPGDVGRVRALTGGTAHRYEPSIGTLALDVPAGRAQAAVVAVDERGPTGADAEIDGVWRSFAVTPNDPDFAAWQTTSTAVRLPEAWSTTTGSASTIIAVVDSGVAPVSELSGRLISGWDFVDGDADPVDEYGHGTASALVAAATGGNSANGAGACWSCAVMPVRVLDAAGAGYTVDIASGIVWAADHGADVINLSLGGPTRSPSVAAAVRHAELAGALVVASAGNDGETADGSGYRYPAAEPGVVSVGAADTTSSLYSWSQHGSWIDVAAPGCNYAWSGPAPVPAPVPPLDEMDTYAFCGTSSAAPMVSGIAGLLVSARPDSSRVRLSNALRAGASTVVTGPTSTAPLVDAVAALTSTTTAPEGVELDGNPLDVAGPNVASGLTLAFGNVFGGVMRFSASGSDPAGIATWDLLVDGGARVNPQVYPGGSVYFQFDTTTVSDGPHQLEIRAIDGYGNESRTAPAAVVVDNTRPSLLIMAPSSGRGGRPISVVVGVNDASSVRATFLAIDSTVVGGFVGAGVRTFPVTLPRTGTHRLVAASIDVAGNLAFSNMVYVTSRRR